jgi:hypothetical protein
MSISTSTPSTQYQGQTTTITDQRASDKQPSNRYSLLKGSAVLCGFALSALASHRGILSNHNDYSESDRYFAVFLSAIAGGSATAFALEVISALFGSNKV